MFPTIQGSESSSSPSGTNDQQMSVTGAGDSWLPTEATEEIVADGGSRQPSSSSTASGARIVIQSSEGHSVALGYEDIVLGLLLVTLAAEAWRVSR